MQAIVCTRYGSPDVLQLEELEKPTPKNNEVLVRVRASSVTAADGMMRKGQPLYWPPIYWPDQTKVPGYRHRLCRRD